MPRIVLDSTSILITIIPFYPPNSIGKDGLSYPSAKERRELIYKGPASFNKAGSSALRACRSEFPPICFLLMKMLGTERWLVISSRASWMAAPSSIIPKETHR